MRKFFGETRHARRPRLEIVPMIDVMLLLLVFYILSTVTLNRQQSIPVKLPKAGTASTTHTVPPAVVTVAANGDLYLNQQPVTLEGLGAAVRALVADHPDGLAALDQKGLVINADMAVQHGRVVAVMDVLRGLEITHFVIATQGAAVQP